MDVFISFDNNDVLLAYKLKCALESKNITVYLFHTNKEYDSTLHDKITNAIDEAQALVAIITNGESSASVHEEIGYAMAKNKSVIIMLEQDALDGVLSHEREKQEFVKAEIENTFPEIIKFLQIKIARKPRDVKEFDTFLRKRNLDNEADNFCQSTNTDKLYSKTNCGSDRPLVLFSAYPLNPLDDIQVNSSDYDKWLKKYQNIKLENQWIKFLVGSKTPGLDEITYDSTSSYNRFMNCIEIHSNGFLEQGFTTPLLFIPSNVNQIDEKIKLHLCWLTGAFWAFLIFCKEHYNYCKYDNDFRILLSIRDANRLTLRGFGGALENGNKWAEPGSSNRDAKLPVTDRSHIQIKETIDTTNLTCEAIKELVKKFADKIANAYGLNMAYCYNYDGTINNELLQYFNNIQ